MPIYNKEIGRVFAKVSLEKAHEKSLGFYATVHEKLFHANCKHSCETTVSINVSVEEFAITEDHMVETKTKISTTKIIALVKIL